MSTALPKDFGDTRAIVIRFPRFPADEIHIDPDGRRFIYDEVSDSLVLYHVPRRLRIKCKVARFLRNLRNLWSR